MGYSAKSSTIPLAFVYRGEVQGAIYRTLLCTCRACAARSLLLLLFSLCCKSFGPSPRSVHPSFCTCVTGRLGVRLASENTVCVALLEEWQDGGFVF